MRRAAAAMAALLASAGLGAERTAADPRPTAVRQRIDAVLDAPAFAPATWGVEVRDLATGRVVYARNAGKNVKPASTMKLVTTAAVLDALGPEHRFVTTVETWARLDGRGRLLGDVVLVGGGDPNLSGRFAQGRPTAVLEELADQVKASGVRRVEGRVIGHEGLFTGERRGEDWTWGDLVWSYGAEVSALSFNDNVAELTVTPGEREGDPVQCDRVPATAYYRVICAATTSAAGASELRVHRPAGTNVIEITGALPRGQAAWTGSVALEDPARYAATVFAEVLAARGVVVSGDPATSSVPLPRERRVLARIESQPLREILTVINKRSQNLHTEMMLRALGAARKGEGSLDAGRAAVEDFLRRIGVLPDAWAMQDASGLSRSDLLSPHEMVSLLAAMDRHPHAAVFRGTLPVAGLDGTLENRMKGTAADGQVMAKTGTIRHVNGLGGYVATRGGRRLAFYAVVNHHTAPSSEATAALDALAAILAGL